MKMLKFKEFEGWVCCPVRRCGPKKGGWDTRSSRLAADSQIVGSLFRNPFMKKD